MATIGTLAVNIVARTGEFDKRIGLSRAIVKEMTIDVSKLGKKLVSGLKFGLTAAAAGAVYFAKTQAQALDKIGKTSDKLGIGTEDLMSFHHAAKLAGLRTETFDMALQRVTRRIGEAARGTGEAKDALAELGLNAAELNEKGGGELFREIEQSFKGIGNAGDRVRLAFKLFDSEGVAILNMFGGNLSKVEREYSKIGQSFSREDVAKIEKMNDEFTKLGTALNISGQQMMIDVSDTAIEAVKGIRVILEGVGLLKPVNAKTQAAEEAKKFDRLTGGKLAGEPSKGSPFSLEIPRALIGETMATIYNPKAAIMPSVSRRRTEGVKMTPEEAAAAGAREAERRLRESQRRRNEVIFHPSVDP